MKIKNKLIVVLIIILFMLSALPTITNADAPEKIKVIIGFHNEPDVSIIRAYNGQVKTNMNQINAVVAMIPENALTALQHNPKIRYIERDEYVQLIQAESLPWGVDRIDAEKVWSSNTGSGVIIAICDTGIDYNHPDLIDNYIPGASFVDYTTDPMDDHGHGTHCAGIAAAVDNDIGVVGVAPGASLMPVKILDYNGGADFSWVAQGIMWAANNSADVISLSIGYAYHVQSWQDACDYAYEQGCVVVAAAGNSGHRRRIYDNVDYPGKYASTIAVAATTSSDSRASFSSTGPDVELAAPGYSIYSTLWDNTYGSMSGTSMACPHVSGVAALVIASGVTGNVNVRNKMKDTAEDLGDSGFDWEFGFGLVDAEAAAGGGGSINNPPVASFTYSVTELTVDLTDASSDSDGSITYWYWNFGDGTTSTAQNPSHTYGSDATYSVSLTVTDDDGATDVTSQDVTVSSGTTNSPPIADFTYTASDLTVDFTDQSTDSDGTISSWYWMFGDGSTSTVQNPPSHTYSTDGTYTVSLTVTDDDGATDTTSQDVIVSSGSTGGSMYVADISWSAAGPHIKSQVTIKVSDSVVSGATVYYMLTNQDTKDFQSFTGTTDSNGQIEVMWKRASSGNYEGLVTNVEHSSYTYDANLDVDNPDYYTH